MPRNDLTILQNRILSESIGMTGSNTQIRSRFDVNFQLGVTVGEIENVSEVARCLVESIAFEVDLPRIAYQAVQSMSGNLRIKCEAGIRIHPHISDIDYIAGLSVETFSVDDQHVVTH